MSKKLGILIAAATLVAGCASQPPVPPHRPVRRATEPRRELLPAAAGHYFLKGDIKVTYVHLKPREGGLSYRVQFENLTEDPIELRFRIGLTGGKGIDFRTVGWGEWYVAEIRGGDATAFSGTTAPSAYELGSIGLEMERVPRLARAR